MKQLGRFLTERKGEKAHREAEKMGLEYKGFGYWVDPKSGKVTHQTQGDSLVPVDPDVETKMAGGGPQDETLRSAKDGTLQDPRQMPMKGLNVGAAPEPGKEQAPRGSSWNPGPDGDNCVTGQEPPADTPIDTFVGKTNYHQWVAGPDGKNAVTMEETKKPDKKKTDANTPPFSRAMLAKLYKKLKSGPMRQPGQMMKGNTYRNLSKKLLDLDD